MMKIFLNCNAGCVIRNSEKIKKEIRRLLRIYKPRNRELDSQVPSGSISITFCDDKYMKKLNSKYRGKNKTTDVLSFEFGDKDKIIGDIYISVPTAKKQAKEYNVSLMDEILRLANHGTLHVLGYTHKEMGVYGS
jgi:probable rRNA maturation factor